MLTEKEAQLEPKTLDFSDAVVGIPSKQTVNIRNRKKEDLFFFALSSTSIHYHCSFPHHGVGYFYI